MIVWLDYYAEHTPGVQVLDNATTILGWKSEPQPDGLLRIQPECGGRTRDEGGTFAARRSWSSRSPRRPGTSTSGRSWPIRTGRGPGVRRSRDRPGRDLLVRPGARRSSNVVDRRGRAVPLDCVSGPLARPAALSRVIDNGCAPSSTRAVRLTTMPVFPRRLGPNISLKSGPCHHPLPQSCARASGDNRGNEISATSSRCSRAKSSPRLWPAWARQ